MARRWWLACLLAASCGGDSGGGPIPITALQASYGAYTCNLAVRCGLVSDVTTCGKLRLDNTTISPDLVAAVQAGLVIYDGNAAAECLAGLTARCDPASTTQQDDRYVPAACSEMFTGTVSDGGTCAIDQECISQLCEVTTGCGMACCQGTCLGGTAPAPRPALGESCQMNTACIDSYCDTANTYTCVALLPLGTSCTSNAQCDLGLACRSGTGGQTCETLAPVGGACTSSSDCNSVGDYCGGTTGMTCTAYGVEGSDCSTDAACSPIYRCDTTMGKCVLGPEVGDACTGQQSCIDKSYCNPMTLTCTALQADGTTCTSSQQCQSNNCDFTTGTGSCTTPPVCY